MLKVLILPVCYTKGVIHLSKPVSVSNLKPDSASVCIGYVKQQFRSSQFLWIHKINKHGSFDDGSALKHTVLHSNIYHCMK